MKIYLASGSAARKKALDILGLAYEVKVSDFDEKSLSHDDPKSLAQSLAEAKARAVGEKVSGDALIIGGDMFTVVDGVAVQKPGDINQARQMLEGLSGKTVQIIGAVAVYKTHDATIRSAVSICNVTFRHLTNSEITDYINRWPVLDYAAAFNGDAVIRFAQRVEGANNMATGFAVNDLVLLLRESGFDI